MTIEDLVSLLSDAYVTYELSIRQEDYARDTLMTKKVKLIAVLEAEDQNPDNAAHVRCPKPFVVDLGECKTLLGELNFVLTQDRVGNAALVDARLKFLRPRIDRVVVPEADVGSVQLRNKLLDDVDSLLTEVGKISVPIPNSSGNEAGSNLSNNDVRSSTSVNSNNSNPFIDGPVSNDHLRNNTVPVWKWDLRFSGDGGSVSATEFLQNVGDYSRSRHVNERELLHSVSDLLTGSARKWYRSMAMTRPFDNWNDFVTRFLRDFEPAYERERVLETIKGRIQRQDENIVKYFITMEDLFLRLPYVPSEAERTRIIRNNLLPCYVSTLALHHFGSVEDLKEACKKIEVANIKLKERRSSNFGSSVPYAQYRLPNQGLNRPNYNSGRQFGNNRPDFHQNRRFDDRQFNTNNNPNRNNYRQNFRRETPGGPRFNLLETTDLVYSASPDNPSWADQTGRQYPQHRASLISQSAPDYTRADRPVTTYRINPSTAPPQPLSQENFHGTAVPGPSSVRNQEGPNRIEQSH